MSQVVSPAELLALDIAAVLAAEPFGVSCDALAKRLHRRRPVVLAALRTDARFVHDGRTHGSRWRLSASGRDGSGWDGMSATTPAPPPSTRAQPLSGADNRLNGGVV